MTAELPLFVHLNLTSLFGTHAFVTVVYLMNCLPTSLFKFHSPHASRFIGDLSHDHLRVFGVFCFPCLHPFSVIKLDLKNTYCNFLRYNSCHNGYKCYDLVSSRIYIPCHFIFDELIFPSPLLTPRQPLTFYPFSFYPLPCPLLSSLSPSFPCPSNHPSPSARPTVII